MSQDVSAGIVRRRATPSSDYIYEYADTGQRVTTQDMTRIAKLKIPPAWSHVWISRDATATIQAIGWDVKGRKQYRYHQVHIQKAEREKFFRMYEFIRAMPKLERVMESHNTLAVYDKRRVIALMLQIVRDYHLRVGKEVYARTNKSYGISSLRKRHVKVDTHSVILDFKGKSNQRLHFTIRDDFYVQSIKMLMRLQGDHVFQYILMDKIYHVTDRDLNLYIQEHMGSEFTIKDFRTYGANAAFIRALLAETRRRQPRNKQAVKKNIVAAFKSTARQLKHTGAVSKKSYVMNFAIELYQNSPEFFVERKWEDITEVLMQLLRLYKRNILETEPKK